MKISIIVPVYNVDPYTPFIRIAFDSIRYQTYQDWEAILVDDGTPGDGGSIVDEYAQLDSRFIAVHKTNGGTWSARNEGLRHVVGDYVTFLDQDDRLSLGWFAEAVRIIEAESVDLLRLKRGVLAANGDCPSHAFEPMEYKRVPEDKIYSQFLNVFSSEGFLWQCFIRRNLATRMKFKPVMNCKEDSIGLLELLPKIKSACQGSYVGYFYRNVVGSVSKWSRKTEQCLAYLDAIAGLWQQEHDFALSIGQVGILRKVLRFMADGDICEWMCFRSRAATGQAEVRAAYRRLFECGAMHYCYSGPWRFWIGFRYWQMTGSDTLVYLTFKLNVLVRKFINSLSK